LVANQWQLLTASHYIQDTTLLPGTRLPGNYIDETEEEKSWRI